MNELPEDIQLLIDQREVARIARNWVEADMLRDKLKLAGFEVEDSKDGPKVSKIWLKKLPLRKWCG